MKITTTLQRTLIKSWTILSPTTTMHAIIRNEVWVTQISATGKCRNYTDYCRPIHKLECCHVGHTICKVCERISAFGKSCKSLIYERLCLCASVITLYTSIELHNKKPNTSDTGKGTKHSWTFWWKPLVRFVKFLVPGPDSEVQH